MSFFGPKHEREAVNAAGEPEEEASKVVRYLPTECPICTLPLDYPADVVKLGCGHYLHASCMLRAVTFKNITCPECRAPIVSSRPPAVANAVAALAAARRTMIFESIPDVAAMQRAFESEGLATVAALRDEHDNSLLCVALHDLSNAFSMATPGALDELAHELDLWRRSVEWVCEHGGIQGEPDALSTMTFSLMHYEFKAYLGHIIPIVDGIMAILGQGCTFTKMAFHRANETRLLYAPNTRALFLRDLQRIEWGFAPGAPPDFPHRLVVICIAEEYFHTHDRRPYTYVGADKQLIVDVARIGNLGSEEELSALASDERVDAVRQIPKRMKTQALAYITTFIEDKERVSNEPFAITIEETRTRGPRMTTVTMVPDDTRFYVETIARRVDGIHRSVTLLRDKIENAVVSLARNAAEVERLDMSNRAVVRCYKGGEELLDARPFVDALRVYVEVTRALRYD